GVVVCIEDLLYPQFLGELMHQHHARVARQLFFPKANLEFPDFTNYTLCVHLLGASLQGNGPLLITLFASTGGTFLSVRSLLRIAYPPIQVATLLEPSRSVSVRDELFRIRGFIQGQFCN